VWKYGRHPMCGGWD